MDIDDIRRTVAAALAREAIETLRRSDGTHISACAADLDIDLTPFDDDDLETIADEVRDLASWLSARLRDWEAGQ